MPVITVAGQPGTRARDIGRAVTKRLAIDYVDQEILVEAARTLGVPMESVVPFDERTASLGERLTGLLRRFLERSAAAGSADPMMAAGGLDVMLGRTYAEAAVAEGPEISGERYVETLTGIVRDLAKHGDVLILGRGGQVILKDWPGALHVLLAAPLAQRIKALAEREGLSAEDAAKRVNESAKGRAAFHHKFFKVDVDDPALYHLTLNTARLADNRVVDTIVEAAQRVTTA